MEPIEAAIQDLSSQEAPNIKATAKKWNVDRTTLSRRWRGVTGSRAEANENLQLLNNQQEEALLKEINRLSERGTPPTPDMVRRFAAFMAGSEPSQNWTSGFIKRHNDRVHSLYLKGFDLSRKKAENWCELRKYFDLVCTPPQSIFNF